MLSAIKEVQAMNVVAIVAITLLVLFVVVGVAWYWRAVHYTGEIIVVDSNNVGNLLLLYFQSMANALQRQQDFQVRWVAKPHLKLSSLIRQLPTQLPYSRLASSTLMKLKMRAATTKPGQFADAVTHWEAKSSMLQLMQPYIRQHLGDSLSALGYDRCPFEGTDVVIHFRCSDSPFNRHPLYTLLRYEYYTTILRFLQRRYFQRDKMKVVVLSCGAHGGNPQWRRACAAYSEDLERHLLSEAHDGLQVDIRCGSIESDLAAMMYAPVLISAGSSMSSIAALARRHPWSILPSTLRDPNLEGIIYEGVCYLNATAYRLPHEQVPDYLNTTHVCSLLRSPTSNNNELQHIQCVLQTMIAPSR